MKQSTRNATMNGGNERDQGIDGRCRCWRPTTKLGVLIAHHQALDTPQGKLPDEGSEVDDAFCLPTLQRHDDATLEPPRPVVWVVKGGHPNDPNKRENI